MELRKSLTLLSLSALVLSGCSLFPATPEPKVVVETQYVEKTIPLQAAPKPMTLNDVTWYVVTEENFQEFIDTYKKENGDPWVFYAVSVRSYESMSINMAEIQRYLQEQKALIVYYEQAIKPKVNEVQTNVDTAVAPSN